MKKNALWLFIAFVAFAGGAYFWKVTNSAQRVSVNESKDFLSSSEKSKVLISVGAQNIETFNLDLEYRLHTENIAQNDELTLIPELGSHYEHELGTLKNSLLAGIIERKLLYQFLSTDPQFDLNKPERYTACLKEWRSLCDAYPELTSSEKAKELLRSRVCELSVIRQYLEEKIFPLIKIPDHELKAYFREHKEKFLIPESITLRQIVLADEKTAIRIKNKVNIINFRYLAKIHSISPEAEKGGYLGKLTKGSMPRVFDVAFKMKPGQISGTLKSTYGFHIFLVEQKFPKRHMEFKEAASKIKEVLTRLRRQEEYQKWIELALHTIDIKIPKSEVKPGS